VAFTSQSAELTSQDTQTFAAGSRRAQDHRSHRYHLHPRRLPRCRAGTAAVPAARGEHRQGTARGRGRRVEAEDPTQRSTPPPRVTRPCRARSAHRDAMSRVRSAGDRAPVGCVAGRSGWYVLCRVFRRPRGLTCRRRHGRWHEPEGEVTTVPTSIPESGRVSHHGLVEPRERRRNSETGSPREAESSTGASRKPGRMARFVVWALAVEAVLLVGLGVARAGVLGPAGARGAQRDRADPDRGARVPDEPRCNSVLLIATGVLAVADPVAPGLAAALRGDPDDRLHAASTCSAWPSPPTRRPRPCGT